MRKTILNASIAACGALLMLAGAGTAQAQEGWSITNLGTTPTRDDCMRKTETAFARYSDAAGEAAGYDEQEWAHYAYEIEPGVNHAVIICPTIEGMINGILIVFGTTGDDDRRAAHAALEEHWFAAK